MNVIDLLEKEQLRTDLPDFRPGDSVRVHLKVVEGERERIQVFEGSCDPQEWRQRQRDVHRS